MIPFEYDDVNVCDYDDKTNTYGIVIDSISAYGIGTVMKRTIYKIPYKYSIASNSLGKSIPILTVSKKGKWGAIDFHGNKVADFKYDMACAFRSWNKGNKESFFAYVKKGDNWGVIDLNGTEVIPCKFQHQSYKNIQKLIKKDSKQMAKKQQLLREMLPLKPLLRPYEAMYTGDITIKKIASGGAKARNRKGKARKNRQTKGAQDTFVYKVLDSGGTPLAKTQFAKVFDREGDAVRVMDKDGKMGVINLNTGVLYNCIYDSIGPFDKYGFAKAKWDDRTYSLGINFCADTYGGLEFLDEICSHSYSVWKKDGIEMALPCYEIFAEMLDDKKSAGVRHAYAPCLKDFYEAHRNEYDPEIRARREAAQKAAAERRQSNGNSFWSLLGDIASAAGTVTNLVSGGSSETGEALSYLGQSLASVNNPTEETEGETISSSTPRSAVTQDISSMQKRVDYIDKRIQEVGQEQSTLMKERDASKLLLSDKTFRPMV